MRHTRLEPFPDPRFARPWGPLAIGGDLSPERLELAYTSGIFPWYSEGEPIQWWSPDPRALFDLNGLYVSRRLARTIRTRRYRVTNDTAFADVMHGCADRPGHGTWITDAMVEAYVALFDKGIAHSVEVWDEGALVGGVYGVAFGGLFAGESMFHRTRDASKVAMFYLFEHLNARGFELFDTQVISPHTARMGAFEVPRATYLKLLRKALAHRATFGPPGVLEPGR
ncbi:MAG: leucyl/phenylalanyl-tRNA--protein transferase [Planctomycetota bacterium]